MKWEHLISNGQCTVIFKDPPSSPVFVQAGILFTVTFVGFLVCARIWSRHLRDKGE